MSRNVVRSISRPCLTAQWHISSNRQPLKRWYSALLELEGLELPEKSPAQLKAEKLLLIQKEDQRYLSEARANVEEVIRIVERLQEDVAALPTTVQLLPEIPPYTLGYPRRVYQDFFPKSAEQTKKDALHVREHLIDLKYQPYEDSNDSSLAKEIAALSEEEKRERHEEKKNQAAAMAVRLRRRAENDTKTVNDTIARHNTKKGQPIPKFNTPSSTKDDADEQTFKDLAEPVVTEGKRAQEWGRSARKYEMKEIERSGWADAGPVVPIRRWLSRKEPEDTQQKKSAVDFGADSPGELAEKQGAAEDVSMPVAESTSNEKLVDDEVNDYEATAMSGQGIEGEMSTPEATGNGEKASESQSARQADNKTAFERLKNSLETTISTKR